MIITWKDVKTNMLHQEFMISYDYDSVDEYVESKISDDFQYIGTNLNFPQSDFPQECYRWDGSNIVVDLKCAKEYIKSKLRIEREGLLKEQDVLFMKALESNQDSSAIIAEKERLRNITKIVDSKKSLNTIKNITCSIIIKDEPNV